MLDGSIPLNYLTGTGNLSGKIKTEIKTGVLACLQVQKDVEMRLVKLENESYKAGLKSPLTKVHVQAFLMEDEQAYNQKLSDLLTVEVQRQEQAEEKLREQVEKENKIKEDNPLVSVSNGDIPMVEPESSSGVSAKQEAETEPVEKPVAPEGKTIRIIQARFEVVALPAIKTQQIMDRLQEVMEKAGITSLKSIIEIE